MRLHFKGVVALSVFSMALWFGVGYREALVGALVAAIIDRLALLSMLSPDVERGEPTTCSIRLGARDGDA